jgi:hypothetical protein
MRSMRAWANYVSGIDFIVVLVAHRARVSSHLPAWLYL